jgi:hypothetical protein
MGRSGKARYAEARRRALTRTRDPQSARPAPSGRRDVADPGRPCVCGAADDLELPHSGRLHMLTETGNRSSCSVVSPAGRCPCREFRPVTRQTAAGRASIKSD